MKAIRPRRCAASSRVLVLGALAMSHPAAAQRIENDALGVEIREQGFTLTARPSGRPVVPEAVFPREIRKAEARDQNHPVWGAGKGIELLHANGWKTALALYPDSPFLHLRTEVFNGTPSLYEADSLDILGLRVDLGAAPDTLRVLGTGGLAPPAKSPGSYTFCAAADPATRRGVVCGWLTHEQGCGVFFPRTADGKVAIDARIDFGRLRVRPGASRPTETLLVGIFDDARLGLEAYADAVARHYAIRLKPKPGVYCTWYHGGASNEKEVAENTAFAEKQLKPFGLGVMQIDDQWQAILPKGFRHEGKIQTTGPVKVFVDSKDNYPGGMALTAKRIASHGMTAGIWFMPFAGNFRNPYFDPDLFAKNPDGTPFHDARWSGTCIDATHPKGEAYIRQCVKRIHGWGYRYFKIDGLHTGAATHNLYVHTAYKPQEFGKVALHDPDRTQIQAYRKCLQLVREEAPDTFVLGCNVSQNMLSMGPAFGLLDAMRIGPDNGGAGRGQWGQVTAGAWHGTNLYFLNGRVWHNDPDPVYVRPSNPIERARWMCSWMAVAGAMHTSSEFYPKLPPDRLDLLKRCLPSHAAEARPVDLFDTPQPRLWTARDGRLVVVGLFNWSEQDPDAIACDAARLGLDPGATHAVFDYWENRFLEPFRGVLKQTLPGGTCRVLAVRPAADHPQLLSTSRHITQGLVDVIEEAWDPASRTLSGKSRVVGGDPYELRIALPAAGRWEAGTAAVDAGTIRVGAADAQGIRATIDCPESREIRWAVTF